MHLATPRKYVLAAAAAAALGCTLGLTTGCTSSPTRISSSPAPAAKAKPAPVAVKSIRQPSAPDIVTAKQTEQRKAAGEIVARMPKTVTGEFEAFDDGEAAGVEPGPTLEERRAKARTEAAAMKAAAGQDGIVSKDDFAPAAGAPSHAELAQAAAAGQFVNAPAPRNINAFGEFDDQPNPAGERLGATGFAQLTFVDEGYDADVSVSADGKQMVFASTRHSDRTDIYRQKIGSQSVTQLTADPADDAFPSYSRDGRKVAFASNRAGTWDIYVMDADGKNVTQVTSDSTHDLHPSFSPDGTKLAFSRYGGRSGRWELWTVDLTGGERKMIGFGLFPDWSPRADKDVIAYQRARQRGTRWFSLWTLELRDGEPLAPTEVAVSTNAAIVAPSWSPEGGEIAFATVIEPNEEHVHGQQDIWIINDDGTDRRRLTDGIGTNATPFWASDDRVYFVSDRGGQECVWSAASHVAPDVGYAEAESPEDFDAGASATLPTE